MRFERKTVTPRMAKAWLKKNIETNRNPKKGKIPMYARDMATGKWQEDTGETIKFDETGRLIDGQNRLHAVVLADVPVTFDVAFDVPIAAMPVLDTGSSRTSADSLKIMGAGSRDSPAASSITRWAIMWDNEDFMGVGTYKPTPAEIGERYLTEEGAFDAAVGRSKDCQRRGLGNGSAAGLACYLFSAIDIEQTHSFFDQYISGADLPHRSAVLALRNRIARARVDRTSRPEQLALFVRAWNNFREDAPMDRIILKRGDLTNLNFPMPR